MKHPMPPANELYRAGISVFNNAYPLDLLCELNRYVNEQPERKQVLKIAEVESFPEPLNRASGMMSALMCGINTAITKRYEPGVDSKAYEMHFDPKEFSGGLIISSLGNFALLSVLDSYFKRIEIPCQPNTVVALPDGRLHSITPPEDGVRNMLFFGHACPKILSGEVQPPIPYLEAQMLGLGTRFD